MKSYALSKAVLSVSASLALAGCAAFGPRDGFIRVAGATPDGVQSHCILTVSATGSDHPGRSRQVSGVFEESFVIGPSRKGHFIELACSGETVASRHIRYGRDVSIGETVAL